MPITTVLFDADGVFQWPQPNRRAMWAALLGGREHAVDAFFEDLLAVERGCYCGDRDFVAALPDIAARWECSGSIDDLLAAWTAVEADPDVVALIRNLRRDGVSCCLATNQEPHRRTHMTSTMNYAGLFDHQFYSCELGAQKPEPRYFALILERLGRPGRDALFIDDRVDNVEAAASVGIRSEVFAPLTGTPPAAEMRRILSGYGLLERGATSAIRPFRR
jgi:putative hydrolase of the HAD superfamily